MTKLNHSRPSLQLADNLRRELGRVSHIGAVSKAEPLAPAFHREEADPTLSPETDLRLSDGQRLVLRSLLNAFQAFVVTYGLASPLLGKVTSKKLKKVDEAAVMFVSCAAAFIKFCVDEETEMLIGTWGWFTDYRERYRRNGNPLYPFLTAAIEDGVVTHINWSVAEGTSEDRLRLEKFGEKLAA